MAPLRDLECLDCKAGWEELVAASERPTCPKCDSYNVQVLLALIGGYSGCNSGGASTRPRQAGSYKVKRKPK
jgi:hypothetical protein